MQRIRTSTVWATVLAMLIWSSGAIAWAKPDKKNPTMTEITATCTDAQRDALIQAAADAGVKIEPEGILNISREGATFVAASITGFEQVPVTDLPRGVDFGFAYLDAPGSGIPTGYYTLRASSDEVRLGEFAATVQLVGSDGAVAAEVPATANAFSLQVPQPAPFARTVVGGGVRLPDIRTDRIIWISGWYFCPNGWVICFDIIIITRASEF